MSASIKHRGARQSERKSARNKVDRCVISNVVHYAEMARIDNVYI